MPLEPAHKAELALGLVRARCLDLECCGAKDRAGRNAVKAAHGILTQKAMSAAHIVGTPADVQPYLRKGADELACLRAKPAGDLPSIRAAEELLRELATGVRLDLHGDGPAAGAFCSCGIHELAAQVEACVRGAFPDVAGVALPPELHIVYTTSIPQDLRDIEPFRLGGKTAISAGRRTVHVVLSPPEMAAKDLWHLAYCLYHELICHASQGALDPARGVKNAPETCHWTEGWMDTLAYDLVCEWLGSRLPPRNWLPLRGERAKGILRLCHEHRYGPQSGLKDGPLLNRQLAREAYRALIDVLFRNGMANSEAEAEADARRFALVANAHQEADWERLKQVGQHLRIALLSVDRPKAPIEAAAACLAFSRDYDLSKLERAVRV